LDEALFYLSGARSWFQEAQVGVLCFVGFFFIFALNIFFLRIFTGKHYLGAGGYKIRRWRATLGSEQACCGARRRETRKWGHSCFSSGRFTRLLIPSTVFRRSRQHTGYDIGELGRKRWGAGGFLDVWDDMERFSVGDFCLGFAGMKNEEMGYERFRHYPGSIARIFFWPEVGGTISALLF